MTLLWIFLAVVLLLALALGGTLLVAIRWGRDWQELKAHGVETSGTVLEKRSVRSSRQQSTHIRYEYVDMFGNRHQSRRHLVTPEAWDAHVEGGPIAVIYSQRRPSVSAPKYLMAIGPRRT